MGVERYMYLNLSIAIVCCLYLPWRVEQIFQGGADRAVILRNKITKLVRQLLVEPDLSQV